MTETSPIDMITAGGEGIASAELRERFKTWRW